jgi:hypothetical protein
MTRKISNSFLAFSFLFNLSRRYGLIPQAAGSAWVVRRGSLMQSDAE